MKVHRVLKKAYELYNQKEIANLLGVSQTLISHWLNNDDIDESKYGLRFLNLQLETTRRLMAEKSLSDDDFAYLQETLKQVRKQSQELTTVYHEIMEYLVQNRVLRTK